MAKYWCGEVERCCQVCENPYNGVMYDASLQGMGWANVCTLCFHSYGNGLGTGRAQRYEKQSDNRWLKTGG